jgi:hypothetical protein
MQARDDPEHGRWVDKFGQKSLTMDQSRSTENVINDDFLDLLNRRFLTQDNVNRGPDGRLAPIQVTSNVKRVALNVSQALAFAQAHNVPLITWCLEIKVPSYITSFLQKSFLECLYECEKGMLGVFGKGAPAFLGQHCVGGGVDRGLWNGTATLRHSVTLEENCREANESIITRVTTPGQIVCC